jgi:Transposase DDE domain
MYHQYITCPLNKQASEQQAQKLGQQVEQFLHPLLVCLDLVLDRRLVRTFVHAVIAILIHRSHSTGLWLSELGGVLLSPDHAPAGTKRLSNLLLSPKWSSLLIDVFLWKRAEAFVKQLQEAGETLLALWDSCVLEKPESLAAEGLCAVLSSLAKRLKRIKPGFYNPPTGRPTCVPGFHWMGLMLAGMSGVPLLASLQWWTTRGPCATTGREVARTMLGLAQHTWGQLLLHIFDQGFAGLPWLLTLIQFQVRFLVRWRADYDLCDLQGHKKSPGQLTGHQRAWQQAPGWDAVHQRTITLKVLALPVRHPDPVLADHSFWLVVCRRDHNLSPWYLLTNEPITSVDDVWTLVFAYSRRWQIEQMWRACKQELAFESPRLHEWEHRRRLLMLASLAYAFLLDLMRPPWEGTRDWLMHFWCRRTGAWTRQTLVPFTRLRTALSQLWLAFSPPIVLPGRSSLGVALRLLQDSG